MLEGKKSVLFISSVDPTSGPASSALDYVEALRSRGFEVDFLTKYPVRNHPDIISVLNKPERLFSNFWFKIWRRIAKPYTEGHSLFYRKENKPPVKIKKVLDVLNRDYDIIIVFFWQTLLSYRTVEAIYDKMNVKPTTVFLCADYSPMTGGCHFMGDCINYKTGCGNCPMLGTYANPFDFTAHNVKERLRINKKLKPIVFTNLYMQQFFKQSPVMQDGATLVTNSIILNLEKFCECERGLSRKIIGITSEDKFVILVGCQKFTDKRKGIKYFIDAINLFWKKILPYQREDVLILTIGKGSEEFSQLLPFKQKHLGYISIDELPNVYSSADVFVSPTINDAGPSMVNQSIACGTPVICFEIGTAIEVVRGTGAGISLPLYDTEGMADALKQIFEQTSEERKAMRKVCRKVAIEHNSYDAFVNKLGNYLNCK